MKQEHTELEEPREQNRGWFYPISIIRLWEEGELNAEQMMLLGIINSLQDPKRGGCWANNGYLAKRWGKTRRWVRRTLTLFEELELIKTRRKEDRRVLVITFQGDDLERGTKRPLLPGNKSSHDHGNKSSHRHSNREIGPSGNARFAGISGEGPDGSSSFGLNGEGKQGSATSRRLCERFHNFLYEKGLDKREIKKGRVVRVPPNKKNAIAACEELLKTEKAHFVEEVLDWYIENFGEPWVPTYYAMTKFCLDFERVKKQMFRQQNRRPEEEDNRMPPNYRSRIKVREVRR